MGCEPFQFHIGSIKTMGCEPEWTKPLEFQFQIGSIKTKIEFYPFPNIPAFQFHIGSIKTQSVKRLESFIIIGFNSTLVRLKLSPFTHQIHLVPVSIPHWFD